MWSLAIKALLADRAKFLTSLLGVTFSVLLVNLQGALLLGLLQKASMLVDYGSADIWVGPRHMTNVEMNGFVPQRWISRVRKVPGVERAEPYIVMFSAFQSPDGRMESVVVLGCERSTLLGNAWTMHQGDARAIRDPDAILVDYHDTSKLGNCQLGDVREINGKKARVVGMTNGIVSFTTSPYVFTTIDRARQYVFALPPGHCSFYLVTAEPGADIPDLVERIRREVPDLDVYDKQTYGRMAMQYWLTRTGIGISFGLAAFLGLLVGLAVVAQTLYGAVSERLKEFATLKALGADDRCVAHFLLAQALGNALIGSSLGIALSVAIAHSPLSTPRAPMVLTWPIALVSVFLVTGVCLLAARLPLRRVRLIDPACVLRG